MMQYNPNMPETITETMESFRPQNTYDNKRKVNRLDVIRDAAKKVQDEDGLNFED